MDLDPCAGRQPFSGAQLGDALCPIAIKAEGVLGVDEKKRQRTILRFDAGGGRVEDVNWMMEG